MPPSEDASSACTSRDGTPEGHATTHRQASAQPRPPSPPRETAYQAQLPPGPRRPTVVVTTTHAVYPPDASTDVLGALAAQTALLHELRDEQTTRLERMEREQVRVRRTLTATNRKLAWIKIGAAAHALRIDRQLARMARRQVRMASSVDTVLSCATTAQHTPSPQTHERLAKLDKELVRLKLHHTVTASWTRRQLRHVDRGQVAIRKALARRGHDASVSTGSELNHPPQHQPQVVQPNALVLKALASRGHDASVSTEGTLSTEGKLDHSPPPEPHVVQPNALVLDLCSSFDDSYSDDVDWSDVDSNAHSEAVDVDVEQLGLWREIKDQLQLIEIDCPPNGSCFYFALYSLFVAACPTTLQPTDVAAVYGATRFRRALNEAIAMSLDTMVSSGSIKWGDVRDVLSQKAQLTTKTLEAARAHFRVAAAQSCATTVREEWWGGEVQLKALVLWIRRPVTVFDIMGDGDVVCSVTHLVDVDDAAVPGQVAVCIDYAPLDTVCAFHRSLVDNHVVPLVLVLYRSREAGPGSHFNGLRIAPHCYDEWAGTAAKRTAMNARLAQVLRNAPLTQSMPRPTGQVPGVLPQTVTARPTGSLRLLLLPPAAVEVPSDSSCSGDSSSDSSACSLSSEVSSPSPSPPAPRVLRSRVVVVASHKRRAHGPERELPDSSVLRRLGRPARKGIGAAGAALVEPREAPPSDGDDSVPRQDHRESGAPTSTEDSGGSRCRSNGCSKYAFGNGRSYQHRQRCEVDGCSADARSKGRCKHHDGGRRCSVKGCAKSAYTKGLCRHHGGGQRCSVEGCEKFAQSKGLCRHHGGGPRCSVEGCDTSAETKGLCCRHGGGRRCSMEGCDSLARSEGLCCRHGGGLCSVEGCKKSAYARGRCWRHGEMRTCHVKGCKKRALPTGTCKSHATNS